MSRALTVLLWNADGLQPKRAELEEFLAEHDVDIALLQETLLRPAAIYTCRNYAVYRTDRPNQDPARPSGGTAVLVHRRIAHHHIPHPGWATELTTVAVPVAGVEVQFTSIYNPPGQRISEAELDQLLPVGTAALLGGDMNAKHTSWGSRRQNYPGKHLRNYLDARTHLRLEVPGRPTHYHHNHNFLPDILDFAVTCGLPVPVTTSVVSDLSSDHEPVLLLLEDASIAPPPARRPQVDWVRYFNHLADRPRVPPPAPPGSPGELDAQAADLQATLQGAMLAATIRRGGDTTLPPRLPDHLREEIKLRRRLRRVWQTTRCPRAKTDFNRQALRTRNLLRDHSQGRWRNFLATLETEDGSLWRLAKCLRQEKRVHRPLHGLRGLVYSAEDKAETFADTMELQFSPHGDVVDDDHCDRVENFVENFPGEDEEDIDPLPPITEQEVVSAFAKLKIKKAPGADCLGGAALRKLPGWVISWITMIFNSCFRLKHFPACWKLAKVIMIPKPGKDHLFPDHHRPISLLPTISKTLERMILLRFPEEFHLNIREEQFGFRWGHSSTLQLQRVVSTIANNLEDRRSSTAVLIDVAKAFDKVWHEGLIYKLARSPLRPSLVALLQSYLDGRTFAVTVGGATSTTRPVTSGVPQGSVLGPVLYLWYTNDIPVVPHVTLSLFADDAMFIARSANTRLATVYAQRQLDALETWLRLWRVKVNPSKCEAISFASTRMNTVRRQTLTIYGDVIPWTSTAKYLGVTLDRKLTFSHHIDTRLRMVFGTYHHLAPLMSKRAHVSLTTKLLLFRMILRPCLLYAAPAWYHRATNTHKKKLQTLQNKVTRSMVGAPWFVRNVVIQNTLGLGTIADTVQQQTTRMFDAAEESPWQHIRALATTRPPPPQQPLLDDPP